MTEIRSAAAKESTSEHSRPSDTETENPLHNSRHTACRCPSSPHSCDLSRSGDSRCARTNCLMEALVLNRLAPKHTHPHCLYRSARSRDRQIHRQATHSPSSSSRSCTAPQCRTEKDMSRATRLDPRSCSQRRSKTPASTPVGHSPLDSQSRSRKDSASWEKMKALSWDSMMR